VEGATPDSLLALHDAGYREVVARLGHGIVLDVGCGVGAQTRRLAADRRLVLGVDYSAATALAAGREHGSGSLRFAGMDGSHLGMRDRVADAAVSSHIIEHFRYPERHVAELARVLADDGVAFIITPNAPADFENPFHIYLFEPEQLTSMLRLFFADVEILGIEGDDVLHADFAARRASGEKLLRLDPLRLRQRFGRGAYVWAYEHALPRVYRVIGRDASGIGSGIDDRHLFVTTSIAPTTPVLFAIARRPRRFPRRSEF
jgi:SAM-dependent methyltransferase